MDSFVAYASIVYGSSPVDAILFFIDVLHWRKYFIVIDRHLVKKVEIRFIIGDISHPYDDFGWLWWYYTNGIIQYNYIYKKWISQWLDD